MARRFGVDVLPHKVHRRRIYILPSGSGLQCALLVVAMLAAGFNYGSNLALGFAFLVASVALVGMHHCHRNLLGLEFDAATTVDAFAGERALLECALGNESGVARWDLEVRCGDAQAIQTAAPLAGSATAGVPARARSTITVSLSTPLRGMHSLPHLELATRYPFGWFRAWTYVQAPLTIFVAPAPRGVRLDASPDARPGHAANAELTGDEDFAGLRAYAPGV